MKNNAWHSKRSAAEEAVLEGGGGKKGGGGGRRGLLLRKRCSGHVTSCSRCVIEFLIRPGGASGRSWVSVAQETWRCVFSKAWPVLWRPFIKLMSRKHFDATTHLTYSNE